jgi:hypothetical protein
MRASEPAALEFVYTPHFEASAAMLDDEAMQRVELELLANPRVGALIADTGGLRKVRVPARGWGKRGGATVIYFYMESRRRVYFLVAYAKNEQADLSYDQKRALRMMVRQLEATS